LEEARERLEKEKQDGSVSLLRTGSGLWACIDGWFGNIWFLNRWFLALSSSSTLVCHSSH